MSVDIHKENTSQDEKNTGRPAAVSRRALLKRGAVSMPVILTLQSGAALARSSNLISASATETTDHRGRTICLDTNSVYPSTGAPGVFDLGDPPQATVNILRRRQYYLQPVDNLQDGVRITSGEMCEKGGTFWWQNRQERWRQVKLPYNGVVLSTGAATSMAAVINDNLI